jgi:hypothetical protein
MIVVDTDEWADGCMLFFPKVILLVTECFMNTILDLLTVEIAGEQHASPDELVTNRGCQDVYPGVAVDAIGIESPVDGQFCGRLPQCENKTTGHVIIATVVEEE